MILKGGQYGTFWIGGRINNSEVINIEFFAIGSMLIYVILIGLSIHCLILFIKLARRGIEALDLYIQDKKNNKPNPPDDTPR